MEHLAYNFRFSGFPRKLGNLENESGRGKSSNMKKSEFCHQSCNFSKFAPKLYNFVHFEPPLRN